jgi:hypothetical protein
MCRHTVKLVINCRGLIICLPPTDRLLNRTTIARLPTLPTNFGPVVDIEFCSESQFGNRTAFIQTD